MIDKKFFKGEISDYKDVFRIIKYPKSGIKLKHPVDLIISRKGVWHYMWSHSSTDGLLKDDAREYLLEQGEHYKFLNSMTGEILKEE